MSSDRSRHYELPEFEPRPIAGDALTEEEGLLLWQEYRRYVRVDFPSPRTGGGWLLCAQGWVGTLPVSADLRLALTPKVPVANIFRMLEVAYRLDFRLFPGLTGAASLDEFFERLASVLARRVLDRCRRGLYRSYQPRREPLPFLRGSLDLRQHVKRPWEIALPCRFQEHTADLEDNQILSWTLERITRSGACSERVLPVVRRGYRALQGFVTPQPVRPEACLGRLYHRLNQDYEPMHALCRFILEHTGPTHERGDRRSLPFLVDMARLFELFVAEWLRVRLPAGLGVTAHERVRVGEGESLQFDIDLVIHATPGRRPLAVLDTKYKAAARAATDDVSQVVTYAELMGCTEAFLVYPTVPKRPLDVAIGSIRVRSLAFPLGGDLETAGVAFRRRLMDWLAGA